MDPACGSGNFLVVVAIIKKQMGHKNIAETIFGIDIMEDNVKECRERLLKVIGDSVKNKTILKKNIICANGLTNNYLFEGEIMIDEIIERTLKGLKNILEKDVNIYKALEWFKIRYKLSEEKYKKAKNNKWIYDKEYEKDWNRFVYDYITFTKTNPINLLKNIHDNYIDSLHKLITKIKKDIETIINEKDQNKQMEICEKFIYDHLNSKSNPIEKIIGKACLSMYKPYPGYCGTDSEEAERASEIEKIEDMLKIDPSNKSMPHLDAKSGKFI